MNNLKITKSKISKSTFGKNCELIEPVNIYGSKIGKSVFVGPFVEITKGVEIGNGFEAVSLKGSEMVMR